jgi:predicted ATPase
MGRAARAYRYNPDVFLLPAWKEIYETDSERKQDWQEAEYTCEMMRITCREHGYNVIEVPKTSVDERAMFVLNTIAGSAYPVR